MMALSELVNQNVSKKMMVALICMWILWQVNAPSWQIMTVGLAAVLAQAILDFTGHGKGQNGNGLKTPNGS